MTHKIKTETFSQKTEHSGGIILLPLTSLFSFVTFHLNVAFYLFMCFSYTPLNSSLKVTFSLFIQFTVLKVSLIFKIIILGNV